jgi:ADP-heptose:LPS heptosyltransferase
MTAPGAPRRMLIVLLGAIGDVTRALPLLCRLKRAYANTEFFWAVEPAAAPLLAHHSDLAGIVVFDRPRGVGAFARFLAAVRAVHADWALDLQRHAKSGIVTFACGARRRIGFHRHNSREGNFLFQSEHVPPMEHFSSKLEQFLAFATYLGAPDAPVEFGLALQPDEAARVEALLANVPRPFAAFFVGSTAESRLWFPERTAVIIDALAERGVGAVLVGGRGEERFAAPIVLNARAPVTDLVGRTSLRDLIGIFTAARLAVGPDCGPMHIAAAVGLPVVSLWGATSAARSAPYGSADLAISGYAPCSPCYLKQCPIGRLCMIPITPAMVLERIDGILSSPRRVV